MKPRAFAALSVVTVVALVVAIATYAAQNRWSHVKVSGAGLVPGLAAQASRIAKIELKQGEKALTLARDKEAWFVADRGGYPAKPEAVRALLVKLAGAELVESKTRNKDRYALLELEDPAAKDAKSRLLRLLDDKGGVIAEAVVGKKRLDAFGGNKSGTYVRKPGDAQTWLASADLDVSVAVRDWVQTGVLDVPAAKIAKVGHRAGCGRRHQVRARRHARGQEAERGCGHRRHRARGRQHRAGGRAQTQGCAGAWRCERRQDRGRRRISRYGSVAQGGRGHMGCARSQWCGRRRQEGRRRHHDAHAGLGIQGPRPQGPIHPQAPRRFVRGELRRGTSLSHAAGMSPKYREKGI
ncbi:MAG: DUF4340 domain-containing protein [Alphaproteobacteria bacterium]|nr:MAG: DUF4340 domain-containing protein [Alphaproteobacteria bacterium]